MSLADRLRQLEATTPEGCTACQHWGMRVIFDGEASDRNPPALCPRCERAIRTIYVEYDDPDPPRWLTSGTPF